MIRIIVLLIFGITLVSCAGPMSVRGRVERVSENEYLFYSTTNAFSSSFEEGDKKASYDSKSPGIFEDIAKIIATKELSKRE